MKAFEYANPTNEKDAVAALRAGGRIALPLAGGMDLVARMKDYVTSPDRVVNVKNALDKTIVATPDGGLKIGAGREAVSRGHRGGRRRRHAADPESRNCRRQPEPASALLVLPRRRVQLLQEGRQPLLHAGRRKPVPRDLRQRRPEPHRPSVEPRGAVHGVRRDVPHRRTERRADGAGIGVFHDADAGEREEGERPRG